MRLGRALALLALLGGVVATSSSCYRAEIDLTLLIEQSSPPVGGEAGVPGSGGAAGEAGAGPEVPGVAGEGGAAGAAGSAGEAGPSCDEAQVDAEQAACRLHLPSMAECTEQDVGAWSGCYAGGCVVCTKSVREYPYYFDWHPCCTPNSTCNSNTPVKCNARCPTPSEHDKVAPCWLVVPAP